MFGDRDAIGEAVPFTLRTARRISIRCRVVNEEGEHLSGANSRVGCLQNASLSLKRDADRVGLTKRSPVGIAHLNPARVGAALLAAVRKVVDEGRCDQITGLICDRHVKARTRKSLGPKPHHSRACWDSARRRHRGANRRVHRHSRHVRCERTTHRSSACTLIAAISGQAKRRITWRERGVVSFVRGGKRRGGTVLKGKPNDSQGSKDAS